MMTITFGRDWRLAPRPSPVPSTVARTRAAAAAIAPPTANPRGLAPGILLKEVTLLEEVSRKDRRPSAAHTLANVFKRTAERAEPEEAHSLAQLVSEQGRALEELRTEVRDLRNRLERVEDESAVAERAERAIRLKDLHEQGHETRDDDPPSGESAARPKRDARRGATKGGASPKRRG